MTSSLSRNARTRQAKQYMAEHASPNPLLTPSITFGNASPCRPLYTGNNMQSARADADQNLQYANGGYQPQIDRVRP